MVKIRNDVIFTEKGDGLFEKGSNYPNSEQIERFTKDVLDKTFENWLLVGRDADPKKFKEVQGGNLLGGIVLLNAKADGAQAKTHHAKDVCKKGHVAMMLLDVVEAICEDEEETENFLDALTETAKHLHRKNETSDKGKEDETKHKEELSKNVNEVVKLKILKGFLDTAIDSFDTFDGKYKFVKFCLGMVIPARTLESDNEKAKEKLRKSMRTLDCDSKEGEFALDMVNSVTGLVDAVMDAVDDGASADGIMDVMKKFADSFGVDGSKLDKLDSD